MKIHLDERELKIAIKEYIGNQGIDLSQREISISLTAGRGDRGHYADIELMEHKADPSEDPFNEASETDPDTGQEPSPDDSVIDFT